MRFLVIFGLLVAVTSHADTTVDPSAKHFYSANAGWFNAAGDGVNGVVISESFCSGCMWGANIGWISLGNGAPVNGMKYGNDTDADFGVNHDGLGDLTGYAYGANIGWINFEQEFGKPRINLQTGELSGYAWGANVGWIGLDNLVSYMAMGPDSDADGLPDAWEFGYTNQLSWMSRPTRQYAVEFSADLTKTNWTALAEGMISEDLGIQGVEFPIEFSNGFIRVIARPPLTP